MPNIKLNTRVTGPTLQEQIKDILSALNRELARESRRMATDMQRYWRRRTPKRTGTLRLSEVVKPLAGRGAIGVSARVTYPGNVYYDRVAARPQHRTKELYRLQLLHKWANRNTHRYVQRALDNAGLGG